MSGYSIVLLCGVAICLATIDALAQNVPAAEEETAKGIVATTVRSRGYSCDHPERAVRDQTLSLPDQAAWVLECTNAKYWVRYDNDVPAEIRQLD
jgi:hypothetical protein